MSQEQLPSAAEVSRTLADILSGPDFQAFERGLLARALTRLWAWLQDWINGVLPNISDAQAELLTVLVVAVCLGVVVVVVARSLPARNPRSARRDAAAGPEGRRTARDWLRIATERARAAEYRHAATALYQGFVLTLERRGAVDFHSSKTPGEYALEAAAGAVIDDREKAAATTFMRSFQEVAFGPEVPTPSSYLVLEELAAQMGCARTGDAET